MPTVDGRNEAASSRYLFYPNMLMFLIVFIHPRWLAGFLNNQYELIRYTLSNQISQCRQISHTLYTLNIWDTYYIYIYIIQLRLYRYIYHILIHCFNPPYHQIARFPPSLFLLFIFWRPGIVFGTLNPSIPLLEAVNFAISRTSGSAKLNERPLRISNEWGPPMVEGSGYLGKNTNPNGSLRI